MISGYPPAQAPAPAPSPRARAKAKRYRVGVLFVHGMGAQERGDTVTEMGDALTDWLRRWLGQVSGADFKIRGALLRTGDTVPSGPGVDALGGQAHVAVTITTTTRSGPRKQEWLLAESWWAEAFRQASFLEVATWAIAAGPWLIASQRAGIGKRLRVPSLPGALAPLRPVIGFALNALLTLVAALVAAVVTPLALGLLLLSLIPIPVLSNVARGLAKNLSGSFGDLLILVRSPVRFAAMAEQVRTDIALVDSQCDRTMVVAHSQGSAVAWHAIRRTAEQPASERAVVALFVSFGQAFRKLKSLYRIQRGAGGAKAIFAALALASTVALAVAAVQGVGLWSVVIAEQGDISEVMGRIGDGFYWLWLLAPIVAVLVIQGVLGRLAGANDAAGETEVVSELSAVRESFPEFRWEDLWASADPAPNGPLLTSLPAGVDSYMVRNQASTILDHSIYWHNTGEFVSAIAFAAASLAPPSAMGVREAVPPALARAAVVRDHRVFMLAVGRMVWFGALLAALYGLRRALPDIGGWALQTLNDVPLLPDWFGGWNHALQGWVAAVLLTVAAAVGWSILAWGWTLVTSRDEAALFGRRDAPIWNVAAGAWLMVASLLPAGLVVALALARSDPSILVMYTVLVILGLLLAVLLNSRGRRFGDPRDAAG